MKRLEPGNSFVTEGGLWIEGDDQKEFVMPPKIISESYKKMMETKIANYHIVTPEELTDIVTKALLEV